MQQTFNHTLLLLARQYRERSQSEVARAAGLNQGHYSRIENGLLPDGPSEENVTRIADVLAFPPAFFYQAEKAVGMPLSVHPFHRKKQGVGERILKRVHAELNFRLIHLRRFLEAIDTKQVLPLPFIDVDEGGGPREIARKMRSAWMIPPGPIDDLASLAERAGVVVVLCEFGAAIDGVTMMVPGMPPCIFLDKTAPADRLRASLAHELGHVIMHRVPTDTMEEEAYTFGAELLLPEKELRREFIGGSVTLEKLARLKAKWRVSMQFILYQAGQLGCLKPHQTQYLWKRISMLGWKTREPMETDFSPDMPKLFPRILKLHSEELGYEIADFEILLKVYANELRYLYGMQERANTQSHLRLIN